MNLSASSSARRSSWRSWRADKDTLDEGRNEIVPAFFVLQSLHGVVQFGVSRPTSLLSRISFNAWLLLIGAPIAMFWTDFFPTSQMRNLRAASKHVEVLNVLFQKDPRFVFLKARPFTGGGGIIWINWEDDSFKLYDRLPDEDVPDVLRIIRSTHPPVTVRYRDHWIEPDKP